MKMQCRYSVASQRRRFSSEVTGSPSASRYSNVQRKEARMTFVNRKSPTEHTGSVAQLRLLLFSFGMIIGPILEPPPLHAATTEEKCTQKLVDEYNHMLTQASESPSTLLGYITHMIDNVVLVVAGALHGRDDLELLETCHPLGLFDRTAVLIRSPDW